MARISADIAKLRDTARRCRDVSREMDNLSAAVRSAMGRTVWEGGSRQRFNTAYQDWERDLGGRAAALENLARELETAAQRLAVADQQEQAGGI